MRTLFFCLPILTVALGSATADKASAQAKNAITDESQAGEDYRLQGEYLGWLPAGDGEWQAWGMQVVSLGEGKFSAQAFPNGLPGNGGDVDQARAMTGTLEGSTATLRGELFFVLLNYPYADIYDVGNKPVGQLRKVRRQSQSMGAEPPAGAIRLFDGSSLDHFQNGAKRAPDGNLMAGAITKLNVGDFRLHVEFRTPYMPAASGQARGNSGVYIQKRYEVQILDSFGLEPVKNGAGALYRQQEPDLNMSLPPLVWQTYDIDFQAARWDKEGNKTANARITVLHNGVPIHSDREITAKTGAGDKEAPSKGPLRFQFHGNPVYLRNIWVVPSDAEAASDTGEVYRRPRRWPGGRWWCR